MNLRKSFLLLPLFSYLFLSFGLKAETARFRLVWQDDPSTTMIVGWDQVKGNGGKVYYDVVNHGEFPTKYAFSKNPVTTVQAKGMSNHFVHLSGLRPNTTYFFVVADSDGSSRVLSFRTAPKNAERLSIIAGSDSRNHRSARVDANKMVSKLRPHCVMFGGDFTENDSDKEWIAWFDDWQKTISKDGRMYPIIPARGNHEYSNKTLIQLFDVKYKGINYALTLGGDLLRIYTLNSMVASGGEQRNWLQRDLASNPDVTWKTAQYHLSTRPHCAKKGNNNDQWGNWSSLFYEYGVKLVVESDAHTVKSTFPLRPTNESGHEEGFIRDDEKGTVYVGEGCWGAPLRKSDNSKSWTRASGSFNSFHWIFVDKNKIEVRFVKTDGADNVSEVNPNNIFMMPRGINIWNPPSGDVIIIEKDIFDINSQPPMASRGMQQNDGAPQKFQISPLEVAQRGNDIVVNWKTVNEPNGIQYEILRSVQGESGFKTIKTIGGKAKPNCEYEFVDAKFVVNNRDTKVEYRLKYVGTKNKPQLADHTVNSRGINKSRINSKPKPGKSAKSKFPALRVEKAKSILNFATKRRGNFKARLIQGRNMVKEWKISCSRPGKQTKDIDFSGIKKGQYVLVIFDLQGKPLRKFTVKL